MGEADSYYNPGQPAPAPPQYSSQAYNGYQPPLQQQPPPPPPQQAPQPLQYGPLMNGYGELDEKQSFDQTFKVEKPKWNDLWAGVLVRLQPTTPPDR